MQWSQDMREKVGEIISFVGSTSVGERDKAFKLHRALLRTVRFEYPGAAR